MMKFLNLEASLLFFFWCIVVDVDLDPFFPEGFFVVLVLITNGYS
jgi:hypothetical protein